MNFGELSVTTSISDNYFNGFLEVYPNPSNGKITLEMNEVNNDRYTVTINNLLGQTVYDIEKDIIKSIIKIFVRIIFRNINISKQFIYF